MEMWTNTHCFDFVSTFFSKLSKSFLNAYNLKTSNDQHLKFCLCH